MFRRLANISMCTSLDGHVDSSCQASIEASKNQGPNGFVWTFSTEISSDMGGLGSQTIGFSRC